MVYETELQHHGILGMKWGIRRFQNKDGSLTPLGRSRAVDVSKNERIVLKKGSEVQRISKTSSEENKGRTYVSFKEFDNLRYECDAGEDGLFWTANYDPENPNDATKTNKGFKVRLKITNDIIAPSYEETIDAFLNSVKDIPVKELATNIYGSKEEQDTPYKRKEYKKNVKEFIDSMKHLSVEEARDNAYLAYSRSLADHPDNQKAFFNELQKRGYNAVVDHNDAQGGYADAPLIIFERGNNLKQISATPITSKDQDRALERLWEKEQD